MTINVKLAIISTYYEVEVACVISTLSDGAAPVDDYRKEHMPKAGVLLQIAAWAYGQYPCDCHESGELPISPMYYHTMLTQELLAAATNSFFSG